MAAKVYRAPAPARYAVRLRPDATPMELLRLAPFLDRRVTTAVEWQLMGSEQRHLVRLTSAPPRAFG